MYNFYIYSVKALWFDNSACFSAGNENACYGRRILAGQSAYKGKNNTLRMDVESVRRVQAECVRLLNAGGQVFLNQTVNLRPLVEIQNIAVVKQPF